MTRIKVREVVRLKKLGLSTEEIGKRLDVRSQTIRKALKIAKEKGLWNGNMGMSFKNALDQYDVKLTENGDWVDRNGKKIGSVHEHRAHTPPSVLKGISKREPRKTRFYRCNKCKGVLTPITDLSFKQRELLTYLKQKGMTYFCPKCKIAYKRDSETTEPLEGRPYVKGSTSEPLNCPKCGNKLAYVKLGGKDVPYMGCIKCKTLIKRSALGLN